MKNFAAERADFAALSAERRRILPFEGVFRLDTAAPVVGDVLIESTSPPPTPDGAEK